MDIGKILLGIITTTLIIYSIPFITYVIFSSVFRIKPAEDITPELFLIGILIMKIGSAIGITLIYYYSMDIFYDKWFLFAFIIWVMFGWASIISYLLLD